MVANHVDTTQPTASRRFNRARFFTSSLENSIQMQRRGASLQGSPDRCASSQQPLCPSIKVVMVSNSGHGGGDLHPPGFYQHRMVLPLLAFPLLTHHSVLVIYRLPIHSHTLSLLLAPFLSSAVRDLLPFFHLDGHSFEQKLASTPFIRATHKELH